MYNVCMVTQPALRKSHFKIFLGYSGNHANTRKMLLAAADQQSQGREVRLINAGEVVKQPHLPEEFLNFLLKFPEALPFQFDSSKAGIILIDNLNLKVGTDPKYPYQFSYLADLLKTGWDVYATIDAEQIFGIGQQNDLLTELVPMDVIELADIIELVDDPDIELVEEQRRIRGQSGQNKHARDAALKLIAMHREFQPYSQTGIEPGKGYSKILVCISSHPLAERLVRAGRKMADELCCEWTVLYIETPDRLRFSFPHSEQLEKTLSLATDLGAKVVQISGQNITSSILEFAREHQVTRIVLGNPKRSWWQDNFGVTLVDKIIRQSGWIEVFVINDDRAGFQQGFLETFRPHSGWPQYLKAIALVLAATLISYPLHLGIEPANLVMIFLAAVVLSAIYGGRGPALMSSILSVLVFDFFMIEPKLSFSISDTQYLITLLGFFVVSVVVSNLVSTVRVQVEESQRRESRTNALYNLSRGLATTLDATTMYTSIIDQVHQAFHKESAIYIQSQRSILLQKKSDGYQPEPGWEEITEWVVLNNQPAGFGTKVFLRGTTYYHPLTTASTVIGILAVQFPYKEKWISTEKKQLLEAYAAMAALAIEKTALSEEANLARLAQEKEKLQTALMNSISHDLRTPLATITGVLSTLHESEVIGRSIIDPKSRLELIDTGWEESERLNRLVGNLLDMTRLESGSLNLNKTECDVLDMVGSVLARLKNRIEDRIMQTSIPEDLPAIWVDQVLIEQVLVNLLDNAIKYSDSGSRIIIKAGVNGNFVEISVQDQGRGLPVQDEKLIFEKFYRGDPKNRVSGSGLGLAICKGLVEIHGGKIWVQQNPDKGVQFIFALPV